MVFCKALEKFPPGQFPPIKFPPVNYHLAKSPRGQFSSGGNSPSQIPQPQPRREFTRGNLIGANSPGGIDQGGIFRTPFCKKGVLKNFAKLTGKHLCLSLFFNKVADLRSATSLKKETLAQVLCCEFNEISKNTFS